MNRSKLILPALVAATLSACAPPPLAPNLYSGSGSMQTQQVFFGTVASVHRITIRATSRGAEIGGAAGGAGGAGIGALFGGGKGALIGGGLGLLGGVLAGSQHTVPGVLITVMFPNGHAVAVPQPVVKGTVFHVGEKVEIVGDARRVRVLPAA
jgi:outer membrane lipoprotein SlyB